MATQKLKGIIDFLMDKRWEEVTPEKLRVIIDDYIFEIESLPYREIFTEEVLTIRENGSGGVGKLEVFKEKHDLKKLYEAASTQAYKIHQYTSHTRIPIFYTWLEKQKRGEDGERKTTRNNQFFDGQIMEQMS